MRFNIHRRKVRSRSKHERINDGNNEWVQCAIKDSGNGIPDEDLPKIFEPFFSKRRGGTGLGLAIAQRIMQEHGGKLIAGNNPEAEPV